MSNESPHITFQYASQSNTSTDEIETLALMVNAVYTESEKGLFKPGPLHRTSKESLTKLIHNQELMILRLNTEIKGCAQVTPVDNNRSKVGMITIHPDLKGKGFGKIMLSAIEDEARQQSKQALMLDLLAPITWVQDHKKFLATWYERVGFKAISKAPFENKDMLATDCEFIVYEKMLQSFTHF